MHNCAHVGASTMAYLYREFIVAIEALIGRREWLDERLGLLNRA